MRRYPELDLLRTAAIILMVVYHFAFDLQFFYGLPLEVRTGGWLVLQRITANLFLLLVGVSGAISHDRMRRKNLGLQAQWLHVGKRAGIILGAGMLVTVATYIVDPSTYVRFGILHLIALSALLLPLLRPLREGTILLGLLVSFPSDTIRSALPPSVLLIPLGAPPVAFQTIDYFPLLPWFATILIGFGLGHLLYVRWTRWRETLLPHPHPRPFDLAQGKRGAAVLSTLSWPGRHSLLIYLIHQPLILAALWMAM